MSSERWFEALRVALCEVSGPALRRKAIAANNVRFVESLLEDGLTPQEVEKTFVMIAQRLAEDGQRPPKIGLYDYTKMQDPGFEPGVNGL